MEKKSYKSYSKHHAEKSPLFLDMLKAFIVGGLICIFGQALKNLYLTVGMQEQTAKTLVPITLIFLTCLTTGIGIFDKLAKHAGAGTLVPITGFANAMVSPAIDNKAEGFVSGLAAKMFVIAGPVIVYGVITSIIYGIIYWITGII